jgi:hypothetical protein
MLGDKYISYGFFMMTFIVFSSISILGMLIFIIYFNKYQRRLKQTHPNEYNKLRLKDSLVEVAGDWIKWPLGSAGPLLAIFNIKKQYDDDILSSQQNRALIWLCIFLSSFILSLLSIANL